MKFDPDAFKAGQNARDGFGNELRYVGDLKSSIDYSFVAEVIPNGGTNMYTHDGKFSTEEESEYDLVSMVSRHSELKKAYKAGDVWQVYSIVNGWGSLFEEPFWLEDHEYRIHPLNKFIRAHRAGETVYYNDEKFLLEPVKVTENFDWDGPTSKYPEHFSIKPKN